MLLVWVWSGALLAYATAYGNLAATDAGIVVSCLGVDLRRIPWNSLTKILRVPSGLGNAYRSVPGHHYRIFFNTPRRFSFTGRSIMTVDDTVRGGHELVRMAAERSGVAITDRAVRHNG